MSVTYTAKTLEYNTTQEDLWDMIALREYGDEHCMAVIQDANFYLRYTDFFYADVKVAIPQSATIEYNLKSRVSLPNTSQLLPWR